MRSVVCGAAQAMPRRRPGIAKNLVRDFTTMTLLGMSLRMSVWSFGLGRKSLNDSSTTTHMSWRAVANSSTSCRWSVAPVGLFGDARKTRSMFDDFRGSRCILNASHDCVMSRARPAMPWALHTSAYPVYVGAIQPTKMGFRAWMIHPNISVAPLPTRMLLSSTSWAVASADATLAARCSG